MTMVNFAATLQTGTIVGIDPGLDGAICKLNYLHGTVEIEDFPTFSKLKNGKTKREVDAVGLANILNDGSIRSVYLEQVGAMPGQGVTSMFSMGQTFGTLLGVIGAYRLPIIRVTSSVWKREMGLRGEDKDASRFHANNIAPSCALLFARKKDHNRAEAFLLAMWGLRQHKIDVPSRLLPLVKSVAA